MYKKQKMSAAGRKAISEAQKARWAARRKHDKLAGTIKESLKRVSMPVPVKEVSIEEIRAQYPNVPAGTRVPFVAWVNPLQRKLDLIKSILEL